MEASENCSVKAVVHVRPLIGDERQQGCREWVTVTPGKPQVQIGTHSFTFDHVYGSGGSPSSAMFGECVAPLVDGLFQGYNATVLAYGQTGSGKTYTMGTGFKDGRQAGLIPEVMSALFGKIETLKDQTEFQMHVSFIEILKEEVRDLLDSISIGKSEAANGYAFKAAPPPRSPIHIRETSDGVITLSGSTDVPVSTLQEMAACLEQGSLIRATGSTNMNSQSSRSHAIFTITLEQVHKLHSTLHGNDSPQDEDMGEEYFCAKLHLVDLAGSERAKRTGSDGLRLKEGIHINKGLLALGNVISALGDEKKQKEGVHVPYRDSKLTRLLQDSLGGKSRTVMIACISPADINAEESLNTLKYANRARNIQNKPVVNKDLVANEMQKMRQQIKLLQSELCARGGVQSDEVQVLKERITLLEATNKDLYRELHEYRSRYAVLDQRETDAQVPSICSGRSDGLKRVFQNIDSFDGQIKENISSKNPGEMEEVAKECEHALRRDTMDKEMIELNRRLKQKESEMKHVDDVDVETVKRHFRKKISELKEEKRTVQKERDQLLAEVESLAANFDAQAHREQDICAQKLKSLEGQILDLKKQENHVQIVKQKQKSDESAQQRLQAEIQYIKSQKVKLQHKIKQEAEQFRQWKASCEKELQQLKKEGRRNEYERHKLQALNQRQKLVLQRKTAEATMATKRLKELLEARKPSARDNSGNFNGHAPSVQGNEKKIQRWLDHELEVMVKMHEVRCEHEKQTQVAALQEELALLKQVEQFSLSGKNPSKRKKGFSRVSSMLPNARMARIASLENMLNVSSSTLVSMDAQLLEAEDRDRALVGRGRWNQLRTMGETKNLLELLFSAAAESRCRLWEKEMEIKDVKEKLSEVVTLLQQSEAQRKEQKMKEQVIAIALSTSSPGSSHSPPKHFEDDLRSSSSPVSLPAPKQLKLTPGIVNGPVRESAAFISPTQKMIPIDQLSAKKVGALGQPGKLWRWKRSHHRWLMQFKWKWAKPWKLSEWIRHNDETIIKLRSPSQARVELIG